MRLAVARWIPKMIWIKYFEAQNLWTKYLEPQNLCSCDIQVAELHQGLESQEREAVEHVSQLER